MKTTKLLPLLPLAGLCLVPGVLAEPPKLVLQITVDALRGDLPQRFRANMGEEGLAFLLDHGVHYTNAHYQHANTETIVGHTALATGAPPAVNGMVGNVWYDRAEQRAVYNIEDSDYSLLSEGADVDQSTEIDATQRVAQGDGRSPTNLLTSTIGDEIVKAYNGHARSFAVSFKDRGAVSMGGELGKAFWFSKASGGFVTSDYYYDSYPEWVTEWNGKGFVDAYHGQHWKLLLDQDEYLFAEEGDVSHKTEIATFKRTFPYPYGPKDFEYFTTMLSLRPAADEIVADFAKTLIDAESLGEAEHPDYLAISFSATDYVIHINGPSSLEAEDALLRLDQTLADLFQHIDDRVGLHNTLIVLSADHGAPDTPGYIANRGGSKADYFSVNTMKESGLFEATKKAFGLGEELILEYADPYVYLNRDLIAEKELELDQVQSMIADTLGQIHGIYQAFAASAIEQGRVQDSRVARLVSNNHHPARSGDIYLVFHPNVYINDFDGLRVASVHGSPWRYDTHVPVIFAGHGIQGQKVSTEVTPYDIAPTIAHRLGISFPDGSTGQVLTEVAGSD